MQYHPFLNVSFAAWLLIFFSSSYANVQRTNSQQNFLSFSINIYKNANCSGKADSSFIIDTAKSCNSYFYVDSKGATITGSRNNIRCYRDKVVYDQYPFSAKCLASESIYQGKQMIEKNHSVAVNVCQKADSHEGPVYQKLSGYVYPGNAKCKIKLKNT